MHVNNGQRWEQLPDGYLDMLFVDLEDFDADTYDLKYMHSDICRGKLCLLFSVIPKMPRLRGQFVGQIWVEATAFKIIRIRGTFTPARGPKLLRRIVGGGRIPLYFNFDSVRQEVAPGVWMPSYSYFDENRTWRQIDKDAVTDIHYRGHIFIWGYQDISMQARDIPGNRPAAIVMLEENKLLSKKGPAEQTLTTIARRILTANKIDIPDVECRVLLTTPVEILSVGHTIVLSRGLLNLVPDYSVIPILLAYIIADMRLHGPHIPADIGNEPNVFAWRRPANFRSLSASVHVANDAVWKMALDLADRAGYSQGSENTYLLLTQLAKYSKQVPNLLRARFGLDFSEIGSPVSELDPARVPDKSPPLLLRGTYSIDSWNGSLRIAPNATRTSAATNAVSF